MMQIHMQTRRPNKWPSSYMLKVSSLSLILLVLVGGSSALLKQQQRSDDPQAIGGQQVSQAQAYQNHQQQQAGSPSSGASGAAATGAGAAGAPASYSSSVSISSSSSSSPAQQSSGQSSNVGQQQQQMSSLYSTYGAGSSSSAASQKQNTNVMSSYGNDNMVSSANAPDASYQAAANSVNMALANSGIFGPSPSASASAGSGSSSTGSYSPSGSNSAQSALNPLHYFYYPSKDSSSQAASVGTGKSSNGNNMDMMSNSASNTYQSMAYPTYADQLNSALSSMSTGPDAAASSQDPSYLPQPNGSNGASISGAGDMSQQFGGQSGASGNQQQQGGSQGAHSSAFGDLSAFSGSMSPQQQASVGGPQQQQQQQSMGGGAQQVSGGSGISFNGPTNGGAPSGGASAQDMFGAMNQHLSSGAGSSSQQQQQMNSMFNQNSNLYNQMGDLSTSNFGNNAGGLSSVASYMSPNQHQGNQHDLFSNTASLLGGSGAQQFSSAASSLSPASVSPPQNLNQQQASANSNSLFGVASSLFGSAGNQQASGSQQQQQAAAAAAAAANNLFSNQHYLNSFLNPQQYGQLAGVGGQQSPMDPTSGLTAAASSPQATSVAASGSSKRFGIGSFIMPMLALAGLSLLIPTMSNIGTAVGRKKRSIGNEEKASRQQEIAFNPINGMSQLAKEMSIGEYMDKIERYYSIYKNAVENDDCLNRLICEFGSAVKDVTGKSAVVTVIEKLVPTWMVGKVHLFKDAALDNKEGKEKCKKYVCHSNKRY